jgi:hypothetical protein
MFLKGCGEGDRRIGKSGGDLFTVRSSASRRIRGQVR